LSYQHDEDFVDLDPCEGQLFIKYHIHSNFEEVGMVHDHFSTLNSFKEFFIKKSIIRVNNELVSLNHNEMHAIQNPFQEDQEIGYDYDYHVLQNTKAFDSPIYDEYYDSDVE
jgi:hypothetical protein